MRSTVERFSWESSEANKLFMSEYLKVNSRDYTIYGWRHFTYQSIIQLSSSLNC